MAELTGFPELTPYDGGWCGNDVFSEVLTPEQRRSRESARTPSENACARRIPGLRLDFLADAGSGEMYLGELNPRVTGASSITNVTAVAYGDMPLFLFHLLEFMDVEYEIDVEELNRRWAHPATSTSGRSSSSNRRRTRRADHRCPGVGHLAHGGRRTIRTRASRHRLAHGRRRIGGFLSAHRGCRRLPVSGRGPGYPGHARAVPRRRPRAGRPGQVVDHRYQVAVPQRAAALGGASPSNWNCSASRCSSGTRYRRCA